MVQLAADAGEQGDLQRAWRGGCCGVLPEGPPVLLPGVLSLLEDLVVESALDGLGCGRRLAVLCALLVLLPWDEEEVDLAVSEDVSVDLEPQFEGEL